MTNERLSIALVGCGGMGRRHLRAYAALRSVGLDHFDVAGVCDLRRDAAGQAADLAEELLGSRPTVYVSPDELLAAPAIQALDVVTDPAAHHRVVAPALGAGLHVICEKPLGVTVRACREMVAAAQTSTALLATAENYRRDPPNRVARRVIDAGLLGQIYGMVEHNIGGSDAVIITPWRHQAEAGPIALDMGVHYADIFRYYLGELDSVYGTAFVAEPLRRLDDANSFPPAEQAAPGYIRATGPDSIIATFRAKSGVLIQLAYVPSGPGRQFVQRSVHGRAGSMTVPRDRTGGPVVVQLGERVMSGAELRKELGGFELSGATERFFGAEGTEYDRTFSEVDAATIGIELDDFALAIAEGRSPEVDGQDGLMAVAAVWGVAESERARRPVQMTEVADGSLADAQGDVDVALGFPAAAAQLPGEPRVGGR